MGFFEITKAHPLQSLKTILVCLTFVGTGGFMSIFGPTLLDLQVLTDVTIEQIALVLPARSAGYAVGSVIIGLIGNIIDHQIIMIIFLLMNCLICSTITYIEVINLMYISVFIGGLASGAIDTVGNVWAIHMWGKESPPFLQLLHFFYGIGALLIPFASEPFLSKISNELENDLNWLNTTSSNTMIVNNFKSRDLMIHWPYRFIAIYSFIVLIFFIIVYCKNPSNDSYSKRIKENFGKKEAKDKRSLRKPLRFKMRMTVIALATLFMNFFVGLEISFGSLLATYAVKSNLRLSKSDGSFLSGIFWASFTFFRLITFFLMNIFSPQRLLTMCLSVIMLSNVILLPFGNTYEWALWSGSIIMGFGSSSVFATMFAFLEHFTPVTPKITACFIGISCIGEFIIPYVVGTYIESNPEVYLYVVFLNSSLSVLIFASLTFILSFLHKKQNKKLNTEICCIVKY